MKSKKSLKNLHEKTFDNFYEKLVACNFDDGSVKSKK